MKLFNDDCLKVLPTIPDNSIDLVVTSPPYNMRTRVNNGKYTTREKTNHFSKKYKNFDDALSIDDYYNFHKKIINEMLRISKLIFF
jgi:site-specific DNA-methyltransferase (adenine-specific)